MRSPNIQNKTKLGLFTLVHSLSGAIFGLNISYFNMINSDILAKIFKGTYYYQNHMVNLFFSIGGILACLTTGFLIRKFPRRYLNISLCCANIVFTLLQLMPWSFAINFFRILIGYISCFYTFISPISFREYLPDRVSGPLGSFFYVGVALGICFSLGVCSNIESVHLVKVVIIVPVYIEVIRLIILLKCFHCESPRFMTIYLLRQDPQKIEFLKRNNFQNVEESEANFDMGNAFGLQEDDEDQFKEDLLNNSIGSLRSNEFDNHIEPDGELLNDPKHSLKLFIKRNDQVQNYLRTFYSESHRDESFNFFFNEFIKVFHEELLSSKLVSWDLLKLGFHKNYRLQMFVMLVLNFLNQMTGVNCLIFYSNNLFSAMEMTENKDLLNILIGTHNTFC
jgi:hypothetical protein